MQMELNTQEQNQFDLELHQFLTFTVQEQEYGVDIRSIREIKAWSPTTRLPNAPRAMRGVINLRGSIIPVFDMRERFYQSDTDASSKHVIIIVDIGNRLIGMLVDTVSDIITTERGDIKSPPSGTVQIDERYVAGLVSIEERMIILLDTLQLFDMHSLSQLSQPNAQNGASYVQ